MVELNSNDYIQIGILCATLVTIIASTVCSYFAIRSATKENRLMIKETKDIAKQQFQLQFFAEYTRRYQEIFLYMPDEIYAGNAKIDAKTKRYMRLYFDLCSEEYHLWKEKNTWEERIVPDEIWNLWLIGMRITCKHGIYNKSWEAVKKSIMTIS